MLLWLPAAVAVLALLTLLGYQTGKVIALEKRVKKLEALIFKAGDSLYINTNTK
jgi:hypothetical protein